MPPSVCLPPLEFCRGVSPSHAAKSRPDLNTLGSGVEAVITEAISLPTPGTLASKRFISLRAWASAICPSRSPIAFLDTLKNSGQRLNGGLGGVWQRRVYFGQLEQFVDAADSLGDDNTEFGKMATQRIDAHRSLLDQQLTRLVQHQRGPLLRALDRNKAHPGTRHRFADRLGVDCVVLAALDIGLVIRGRNT